MLRVQEPMSGIRFASVSILAPPPHSPLTLLCFGFLVFKKEIIEHQRKTVRLK